MLELATPPPDRCSYGSPRAGWRWAVRAACDQLFVNVDAPARGLHVEILDERGKVLAPFSRSRCAPVKADKTLQQIRWRGTSDLSALKGQPVRVRFQLRNGRLYSFWMSPDESGASRGYVAAGGPGFTGPTDTVGSAASTRQ